MRLLTIGNETSTRMDIKTDMRMDSGMTLVELLITIVVVTILLAVAVPSFISFQMDNRRAARINELASGLNLARSEATKSNETVAFCPSSDGVTCTVSEYEEGWIVFLNDDADDPPAVDVGETLLRAHTGSPKSGTSLRATGIGNGVNFAATGLPSTAGDITYCDDRGDSEARNVIVTRVGLIRASDVHADGSALSCP